MSTIRHAGLSDTGRVRSVNEDRWFADPEQGLYLVADGIGGSANGGLAAQIVAEVLPRLLRQKLEGASPGTRIASEREQSVADTVQRVSAALIELSEQLRRETQAVPGLKGIGSTVVLALIRPPRAIIGHLGDSRAYLLHAGRLEQLTQDHTLAQLLLGRGEIGPDQAASHPARAQLTRFIGMSSEAIPEVKCIDVAPGDRLLLCSDGLSGMLGDPQIQQILTGHPDPGDTCGHLIAAANNAGGRDNVTAMVVAV